MKPISRLTLAALLVLATTSPGLADITIRVSIKFFTDDTHNPPAVDDARGPTPQPDTPHEIAQWLVAGCNDSPSLRQRGFRFTLSEPAVLLPASLSSWFTRDPRNGPAKAELETAALNDRVTFRYRADAVNVYINNVATSGSCSFPAEGSVTFLGRNVYRQLLAHEAGHFFNLCHTQGCECAGTAETLPEDVICRTQPGNDHVDDTLLDLDSWDTDQLSLMNFRFVYDAPEVSDAQRVQVDFVYQNLMSYHLGDPLRDGTANPYNLLTDDQLDRYTATANQQRLGQVLGRTWFVAENGVDGTGRGLSTATALRTLDAGLQAISSAADVILLRSATFIAPSGSIGNACTLRATRGPVIITR